MLILFDIDGTLLLSGGAGVAAFLDSCSDLFGNFVADDRKRFSGGMDPIIFRELCELHGVEHREEHHDRFRKRYHAKLVENLTPPGVVRRLPGVAELIAALAAEPVPTLGLLTGNYPETGAFKIRAAGLDPAVFRLAAWGTDGPHRRDLAPVAMRRYAELHGREVAPRDVVIIGDTPKDVDCARHSGCRVLGVATGLFSVEELMESGADRAVSDLTQTRELVDWLLNGE